MPGLHQHATTRRRILLAGLAGTAAVVHAGDAAADEPPHVTKLSPEAVHYQPTPKDWQKCLFCTYFQAPETCGIVAGKVSPQGWCTRFALLHE
ncbi:hypothetical protein [Rhodopila globiformis]|uniref:High potential iron-sulfur proteins family profile domain-containing protein n=1 Tax=Rhodopila globiformis TaxID=1071 RepID=A0A2S6N4G9_RHOGL|nr:hypothetical protein [Rhodopila globiformis]PPQ29498.1 hypothetical protein CCS01_21380 [Rhodopila globiformis]